MEPSIGPLDAFAPEPYVHTAENNIAGQVLGIVMGRDDATPGTRTMIRCLVNSIINSMASERSLDIDIACVVSTMMTRLQIFRCLTNIMKASRMLKRNVPAEWFMRCMSAVSSRIQDSVCHSWSTRLACEIHRYPPTVTRGVVEALRADALGIPRVTNDAAFRRSWADGVRATFALKAEPPPPLVSSRTSNPTVVSTASPGARSQLAALDLSSASSSGVSSSISAGFAAGPPPRLLDRNSVRL